VKKYIVILFCFLGQSFLFSQPYYTLPDSNSSWVVVRFLSTPFTYQWYKYYTSPNKNDTLINSKIYSKLFEQISGYAGAFRGNTSGETWFVAKDSTQEYILMDLTKNVGDAIYNIYTEDPFELETAVVDSVSFITVGPYTL